MDIIIENYIDFSGQDILMDSLPEEKRREIAELIQEHMMIPVGYRRTTA